MLDKLLKYEVKATARLFLPLYLTIVIFAGINRFFLSMNHAKEGLPIFYGIAMSISMFAYVILMIGLVVMTLFVLIQRFYKNLLGDEGYLMFTLPVKTWKHIFSKLIIAMLWIITSSVVAFFSLSILFSQNFNLLELINIIVNFIEQAQREVGITIYIMAIEAIALALLTLASTVLQIYAAIALGHLFNKHKLLISFGMYIALQTVSQIIISISAAIFFQLSIFTPESTLWPSATLATSILSLLVLYSGAFVAGYFYLTNYILKRKLNLE